MHYLNYKDSCGHVKCVSSGSPATSVTWMKDGQPLNTDRSSNYTFSQEISDREDSTYTNVLVVSRMTTGNYTCTVTNDLGSTSMDIIVDSGEFTQYNLNHVCTLKLTLSEGNEEAKGNKWRVGSRAQN